MGRGWRSWVAGGSLAARFGVFLGLLLTTGLLVMHGIGAQQGPGAMLSLSQSHAVAGNAAQPSGAGQTDPDPGPDPGARDATQDVTAGDSHGSHAVTQPVASGPATPAAAAPTAAAPVASAPTATPVAAPAAAPAVGGGSESCADCGVSDHLTMAMACALALLFVVVALVLRRGMRATIYRRIATRRLLAPRMRRPQRPSLIALCISRT